MGNRNGWRVAYEMLEAVVQEAVGQLREATMRGAGGGVSGDGVQLIHGLVEAVEAAGEEMTRLRRDMDIMRTSEDFSMSRVSRLHDELARARAEIARMKDLLADGRL
jgi:hypothetical protein